MNHSIPFAMLAMAASPFTSQAQVVTWSEDAACIIYSHCSNCHRSDGMAPFNLMSYQDVVTNGTGIRAAVSTGEMPPWPPAGEQSHLGFRKDLSEDEKSLLIAWIDQGMPRGDSTQEPATPAFTSAYQIAIPDLIIQLPTYQIPSNLTDDIYRCFPIPSTLNGVNYLTEIEVVPGNGNAVHHALMYWDNSGIPALLDAADPGPGYTSFGGIGSNNATLVGGWVPGQDKWTSPPGMGFYLPQGGDFVTQIHYPLASAGQWDSTSIRLKYTNTSLRPYMIQPVLNHSSNLINGPFAIPAGQVKTFHEQITITQAITVTSILPHAHLICVDMLAYGITPTGDTIHLIDIPHWDFHWQMNYTFKQPIKIPSGTIIHGYATYDNTVNNPNNPSSPPVWVTAGESTTDEMMIFFLGGSIYQAGDENLIIDPNDHLLHWQSCSASHIGLEDLESISWDPYPNPASSHVTLGFPAHSGQLTVWNALGEIMFQGDNPTHLDVSNWPAGIYLGQIALPSGTFAARWAVVSSQ